MSIAKPFTFVANTYAKASEVNADFDTVYAQVNTNISAIAQNSTDIDNLENNKADINGSSAQRFAVADAITNSDAINKQSLIKAIGNILDYISGLIISKDSGSPEDTIIVSPGSCYDSTHSVVLSLNNSTSKQNLNQAANATYYVYIIGNSTGSSVDILISTSSTTPALPSGYTLFKQIGRYTTDGDGKINTTSSCGHPINQSFPKEVYSNGQSWYRVYEDGWCEQGGVFTGNGSGVAYGYISGGTGDTATISLLKNFSNTDYIVELTGDKWQAGDASFYVQNKTVSNFKYCWGGYNSGSRVEGLAWVARGYIS